MSISAVFVLQLFNMVYSQRRYGWNPFADIYGVGNRPISRFPLYEPAVFVRVGLYDMYAPPLQKGRRSV